LQALALRGGHIGGREYSISPAWGLVLRAKLTLEGQASAGALTLICWSKPGERVQLFVVSPPLGARVRGGADHE
jgi:hypothetical protein